MASTSSVFSITDAKESSRSFNGEPCQERARQQLKVREEDEIYE